jgi:hypothetical protein
VALDLHDVSSSLPLAIGVDIVVPRRRLHLAETLQSA